MEVSRIESEELWEEAQEIGKAYFLKGVSRCPAPDLSRVTTALEGDVKDPFLVTNLPYGMPSVILQEIQKDLTNIVKDELCGGLGADPDSVTGKTTECLRRWTQEAATRGLLFEVPKSEPTGEGTRSHLEKMVAVGSNIRMLVGEVLAMVITYSESLSRAKNQPVTVHLQLCGRLMTVTVVGNSTKIRIGDVDSPQIAIKTNGSRSDPWDTLRQVANALLIDTPTLGEVVLAQNLLDNGELLSLGSMLTIHGGCA